MVATAWYLLLFARVSWTWRWKPKGQSSCENRHQWTVVKRVDRQQAGMNSRHCDLCSTTNTSENSNVLSLHVHSFLLRCNSSTKAQAAPQTHTTCLNHSKSNSSTQYYTLEGTYYHNDGIDSKSSMAPSASACGDPRTCYLFPFCYVRLLLSRLFEIRSFRL